jgi:hypothetical protein
VPEPGLFEPFVNRLERLGIPYFVTGSTDGILYDEPRLTHDVDIVVALSPRDIQAFVDALPLEEFYCPRRRSSRSRCGAASMVTAT